jgi:hypothetical protein
LRQVSVSSRGSSRAPRSWRGFVADERTPPTESLISVTRGAARADAPADVATTKAAMRIDPRALMLQDRCSTAATERGIGVTPDPRNDAG